MVDHFAKLLFSQCAVQHHGIPKLFIHVVTGSYFRIVFAELYGEFRVALYVELIAKADAG